VREGDEFSASFNERMTVTVAEGVLFQGRAIEARGRAVPGTEVNVETVAPTVGLDPANPSLDELVDYLERASRIIASGLDSVGISRPEALALFGLLSHCTAMLESVIPLVRDRRALKPSLWLLASLNRLLCFDGWLITKLSWVSGSQDGERHRRTTGSALLRRI
jgi:hypothetical protein